MSSRAILRPLSPDTNSPSPSPPHHSAPAPTGQELLSSSSLTLGGGGGIGSSSLSKLRAVTFSAVTAKTHPPREKASRDNDDDDDDDDGGGSVLGALSSSPSPSPTTSLGTAAIPVIGLTPPQQENREGGLQRSSERADRSAEVGLSTPPRLTNTKLIADLNARIERLENLLLRACQALSEHAVSSSGGSGATVPTNNNNNNNKMKEQDEGGREKDREKGEKQNIAQEDDTTKNTKDEDENESTSVQLLQSIQRALITTSTTPSSSSSLEGSRYCLSPDVEAFLRVGKSAPAEAFRSVDTGVPRPIDREAWLEAHGASTQPIIVLDVTSMFRCQPSSAGAARAVARSPPSCISSSQPHVTSPGAPYHQGNSVALPPSQQHQGNRTETDPTTNEPASTQGRERPESRATCAVPERVGSVAAGEKTTPTSSFSHGETAPGSRDNGLTTTTTDTASGASATAVGSAPVHPSTNREEVLSQLSALQDEIQAARKLASDQQRRADLLEKENSLLRYRARKREAERLAVLRAEGRMGRATGSPSSASPTHPTAPAGSPGVTSLEAPSGDCLRPTSATTVSATATGEKGIAPPCRLAAFESCHSPDGLAGDPRHGPLHEAERRITEVEAFAEETAFDKEEELRHLRILMRFSELKKDSDELEGVRGELRSLAKEKFMLQREVREYASKMDDMKDCLEEVGGLLVAMLQQEEPAEQGRGGAQPHRRPPHLHHMDTIDRIKTLCEGVHVKLPDPSLSLAPTTSLEEADVEAGDRSIRPAREGERDQHCRGSVASHKESSPASPFGHHNRLDRNGTSGTTSRPSSPSQRPTPLPAGPQTEIPSRPGSSSPLACRDPLRGSSATGHCQQRPPPSGQRNYASTKRADEAREEDLDLLHTQERGANRRRLDEGEAPSSPMGVGCRRAATPSRRPPPPPAASHLHRHATLWDASSTVVEGGGRFGARNRPAGLGSSAWNILEEHAIDRSDNDEDEYEEEAEGGGGDDEDNRTSPLPPAPVRRPRSKRNKASRVTAGRAGDISRGGRVTGEGNDDDDDEDDAGPSRLQQAMQDARALAALLDRSRAVRDATTTNAALSRGSRSSSRGSGATLGTTTTTRGRAGTAQGRRRRSSSNAFQRDGDGSRETPGSLEQSCPSQQQRLPCSAADLTSSSSLSFSPAPARPSPSSQPSTRSSAKDHPYGAVWRDTGFIGRAVSNTRGGERRIGSGSGSGAGRRPLRPASATHSGSAY